MSEVRRVLLANGQYIEIVQGTGSSTGSVMSQNAVTTALNGKANTTHNHTASNITGGTFSSARIADGAITSGKLAANAVTTAKVVDGAITKAKLASDVINSLPTSSYETVVVTATVNNNQSANGLAVSINGVQYTFNSTGKIYTMIPSGQVYSVTPISTAVFNASGGGTYTASTGNRSVSVAYTVGYGVYIEDKQGVLYNTADWSSGNNANANSVVVLSSTKNFRIALKYLQTMAMNPNKNDPWETYLSGTTNSGITSEATAKVDYNGAANTQLIITKCQSSTSYAAGACNAYTFPDGKAKGYLPAAGELCLTCQNKEAINKALSACGGDVMRTDAHWSSTFYGIYSNYRACWRFNGFYCNLSENEASLNNSSLVRPFGAH